MGGKKKVGGKWEQEDQDFIKDWRWEVRNREKSRMSPRSQVRITA